MLLTGGADHMIRRWDSETGEPIGSIASGGVDDPLPPMPAMRARRCFAPASPANYARGRSGNRAGPNFFATAFFRATHRHSARV